MTVVQLRRRKWAERHEKRPKVAPQAGRRGSDNLPGMAAFCGLSAPMNAVKKNIPDGQTGGGSGIRTHGTLARTTVFEIDRSGIPPRAQPTSAEASLSSDRPWRPQGPGGKVGAAGAGAASRRRQPLPRSRRMRRVRATRDGGPAVGYPHRKPMLRAGARSAMVVPLVWQRAAPMPLPTLGHLVDRLAQDAAAPAVIG
ncbi:MAG: hypothetical protein K0S42_2870, partial [Microvirga sp.]|nr:hypothetical protein [Microvirga sp.]